MEIVTDLDIKVLCRDHCMEVRLYDGTETNVKPFEVLFLYLNTELYLKKDVLNYSRTLQESYTDGILQDFRIMVLETVHYET